MKQSSVKTTRRSLQFAFLAITVVGVFVVGGNAERWCPFGGVETLWSYISGGNMLCSLGMSNLYILGGVLAMTLLARRAFCSHVCPIGTLSEWVNSAGKRMHLPHWRVPAPVDRVLRLLKYVLLVLILFLTIRSGELWFRGVDPCYALISRHGEDITFWAYVISGSVIVASLLTMLPFCRWFCPLAAVLNPFSRAGVTTIRRDTGACQDCGLCTKECPVGIEVDGRLTINDARCVSCLNCVSACPWEKEGALRWTFGGKTIRRPALVMTAIVLLCIGVAIGATYAVPMPSFIQETGAVPAQTATVEMDVAHLTCRGRASLLAYFLERDDEFAVPGYVRIEAWPGPGDARVRVTYDPSQADEIAVKDAMVQAYYDATADIWRPSPFVVRGYDPLGLE